MLPTDCMLCFFQVIGTIVGIQGSRFSAGFAPIRKFDAHYVFPLGHKTLVWQRVHFLKIPIQVVFNPHSKLSTRSLCWCLLCPFWVPNVIASAQQQGVTESRASLYPSCLPSTAVETNVLGVFTQGGWMTHIWTCNVSVVPCLLMQGHIQWHIFGQ